MDSRNNNNNNEDEENDNKHVYNLRRERRGRAVKYTFSPERKKRKLLSKQSQLADRKRKRRLVDTPKTPYIFPVELKKVFLKLIRSSSFLL